MVARHHGNNARRMWYVIVMVIVRAPVPCLANTNATDFMVTIPFSFVAERWGVRFVLWCNLIPRVFMSAWAVTVGE